MISLSHKTNRLYVAVLPLKCGKNVSVALICASCATFFFSYDILRSSVIYYWTDTQQHGIYSFNRYQNFKLYVKSPAIMVNL